MDIVIGSHPHVLQRMDYFEKNDSVPERFIAYSLGNFVSNQRVQKRDGGALVALELTKSGGETRITQKGYHLIWVNKPKKDGKTGFEVIPCATYEQNGYEGLDEGSIAKMKLFMRDSRSLLQKENKKVDELKYPAAVN